jgi:hypothetical protein
MEDHVMEEEVVKQKEILHGRLLAPVTLDGTEIDVTMSLMVRYRLR